MLKTLVVSLLWSAVAFGQTNSSPSTIAHATEPDRKAQANDLLNQALADKNPDTRKQAAIALSLVGSSEPYATRLESLLDDKDVEVRLAAIASLTDVKNARTIPALRKALNDDVPEVSFAAAQALWRLKDPEGKKALLAIVSGESKASSGYFAKQKRDALRMTHTPKTMFLFIVKEGAGFAPIPGLGAGVSSAQALLSDPSVSGRATAILLLESDKDLATLAAVKEALQDKEWSVRAAAVHALVLRDDLSLRPEIAPLLDDKSEPVRLRAAAGYLRLNALSARTRPVKKAPPKQ